MAINEGRQVTRHEALDLLAIRQEELDAVGVPLEEVPGDTSCAVARALHRDVVLDKSCAVKLARILLDACRQLQRCKKGQMKQAERMGVDEGCFAVLAESVICKCSATRPGS